MAELGTIAWAACTQVFTLGSPSASVGINARRICLGRAGIAELTSSSARPVVSSRSGRG
jgi:hypothetical protein